jgi:DNA-directed RNA polymerase subunit M/transcription elongation factor TFIIS
MRTILFRPKSRMTRNLIVVTTFSRALEARIASQRLEQAGIVTGLEEGMLIARNELETRRFRRVRLLVEERDYERARLQLGLECARVEPKPGRPAGVCPECGHAARWHRRLASLFRSRSATRWRCESCGFWWQEARPALHDS